MLTSRGARTLSSVTRVPPAVTRPLIRTVGNGSNASGTSAAGAMTTGATATGAGLAVAAGVGSAVASAVGVGKGVAVAVGVGVGVGGGGSTTIAVGFEVAVADPAVLVTFKRARRYAPKSAVPMTYRVPVAPLT